MAIITTPIIVLPGQTLKLNGVNIDGSGFQGRTPVTNFGTLTLENVTIKNGRGVLGGAIKNSGDLTLENVIIENNEATLGGGIYNTGTVSSAKSSIQGNKAQDGGGVVNLGTYRSTGDAIADNQLTDSGNQLVGGFLNQGSLYTVETIFSGNENVGVGNQGTAYLTNALVSLSSTGVENTEGAYLEISQSHIILNNTGILSINSDLAVKYSTVYHNQVGVVGVGGETSMYSSIVAGGINDVLGKFKSQGYNWIGLSDGDDIGFVDGTSYDFVGTSQPIDPGLTLETIMGFPYYFPVSGSPVIDKGGATGFLPNIEYGGYTVSHRLDQAKQSRVVGEKTDIGAIEYQAAIAPTPTPPPQTATQPIPEPGIGLLTIIAFSAILALLRLRRR